MKISETWLREWVHTSASRDEICTALTMAGLEIEEAVPVAPPFSGVVVGEVLRVEKHPEADRLNLCEVSIGASEPLHIVCGAENVKAGIKVPVATIGAELPNDLVIKPATIRGSASEGMLCSARELGISDDATGLLILPEDAPVGNDVRDYLVLNDYTIDVSITPNRGDVLSIRGLAREVGALTNTQVTPAKVIEAVKKSRDVLPLHVADAAACPHYVGRIIRHIKSDATTPVWMKERLRRSGIRSIHPVVDVTNYVMLEQGQPMHAFDFNKLRDGIDVRMSKQGEKIALLDGSTQELDDKTLIIADKLAPLAIAGVMGGLDSAVTVETQDIFLESAYFAPAVVARQRQYYQLNSDSAYRYERGVDPAMQRHAMERATALILEITGGEVGPLIEVCTHETLPKKRELRVSDDKIIQVLGMMVPSVEVKRILTALGFLCKRESDKWIVQPPTWRFDISLPEDIIEEIARLYGFDNIPMEPMTGQLNPAHADAEGSYYGQFRQAFSSEGFHEIISYSFIDRKLQALLDPSAATRELINPITDEMSVMRTNLWGGLLNSLVYNKSRQQHRVKLFEIGACFLLQDDKLQQLPKLGGLISGSAFPDQWAVKTREVDFYDLKGSLDNILAQLYPGLVPVYKPDVHPALHPGQAASIYLDDRKIGIIGALHPSLLQALDVKNRAFLFEIDLSLMQKPGLPAYQEVSKFPEIRRDLAILVDQAVPALVIQDTIKVSAGDWLKECFIFDVYQGQGVAPGMKSVALAMILQHPSRTLVDDEVVVLTDRVVQALKGQLGAELRS